MSAPRASPGPLTTHPMTATEMGALTVWRRPLHLVGDLDEVHLATPAGGTAHKLGRAAAHAKRLQQLPGNGTSSWGGAVRDRRIVSPMPSESSTESALTFLDGSLANRACLGNAKVQRHVRQNA